MKQDRGYDQVSAEELLEHFGCDYRETSGRQGLQWNVKDCPRCGAADSKVYLNQETGLGNCFKCGPFNKWSFAAAAIGSDDAKAIGQTFDGIAKLGGWKPKIVRERVEPVPVITGELKLPRSMALPTPDGQTLPYLNDRGITLDLQAYFGLRYCHDGAFFYAKEDGTACRMPFSGRVVIPVLDLVGELVTFQGRDITGEAEKKYLFPPRLPGTARFLYNGHNAVGCEHIVMGEGAFDVIATKGALNLSPAHAGIEPVGSFGKNLTLTGEGPNQLTALLELKARGLKRITILWDGTADALLAACHAAQQLSRYGFESYVAFLPAGKDPNEVDAATVLHAIDKALPYSAGLMMKIRFKNPYGVKK